MHLMKREIYDKDRPAKRAKFISKDRVEKKRKEEEEEAEKQAALADFANYFDSSEGDVSFVHAGTLLPGAMLPQHHHHHFMQEPPQQPKVISIPGGKGFVPGNGASPAVSTPSNITIRKEKKENKKSIDNLLEELKAKQKMRQLGQEIVAETSDKNKAIMTGVEISSVLVISNLCAKTTEEDLLREFGRYGDISSIKMAIVDETGARQGRGLICFMERSAAEEAKEACQGKELLGCPMKIAWGRPHVRPEQPMFVRDAATGTCELNKNLPIIRVSGEYVDDKLINALADQVAKEGVVLEEFVKAREKDNPHFQWLVQPYGENGSPQGCLETNPRLAFYKWRVYSLTQGDTLGKWRTCPFQMFLNGIIWVPPIQSERSRKRAREAEREEKAELKEKVEPKEKKVTFAPEPPEASCSVAGVPLTEEEQEDFFEILRGMDTTRQSIRNAMVFVMDHAASAGELVDILTEALTLNETPPNVKVARLFLVNDILHNSSLVKVRGAAQFRRHLEKQLPAIFASFNALHGSQNRLAAAKLEEVVNTVLAVWESWSLYPQQYLSRLRSIFRGRQ